MSKVFHVLSNGSFWAWFDLRGVNWGPVVLVSLFLDALQYLIFVCLLFTKGVISPNSHLLWDLLWRRMLLLNDVNKLLVKFERSFLFCIILNFRWLLQRLLWDLVIFFILSIVIFIFSIFLANVDWRCGLNAIYVSDISLMQSALANVIEIYSLLVLLLIWTRC